MRIGFLKAFLFTIVTVLSFYFWFFSYFTEQIENNFMSVKYYMMEKKAKNIKKEKIIILAGSNAIFGINSPLLEKKTGYPVLNLSSHAALDLVFYNSVLERTMEEGDIVVMPLEFSFYFRDKVSTVHVDEMTWWGGGYLDSYGLFDMLRTSNISSVLAGRFKQFSRSKITQQQVYSATNGKQISLNKQGYYSWQQLTENGEFLYKHKPTPHVQQMTVPYIGISDLSPRFLTNIKKTIDIINSKNGRLLLTYPVTMRNSLFNLKEKVSQDKLVALKKSLAQVDLDILCNPALFHYSMRFFLNTHYHLNYDGALLRTNNLASCIESYLKGENVSHFDFSSGYKNIDIQQELYNNLTDREKRINDLNMINDALNLYYVKNGFFPKSIGFDGLYTSWGEASEEWIKGIVPDYIKELPSDPRNTSEPNLQYLYKSNGRDYKLIAHGVKAITAKDLLLTDPRRPTHAIGFWTTLAKDW